MTSPRSIPPAPPLEVAAGDDPDIVTVDGDRAVLAEALELWMRVQLGQLDRVCGSVAHMDALLGVRTAHALPDAWPRHPHSSWGVNSVQVGDDVRVAHRLWRRLTGATGGEGTFVLASAP